MYPKGVTGEKYMEKKVVDALAIGYITAAEKRKPRESVGRKGTDPRWNDDRLISWKDRWTDLQDDCRVDANKMAPPCRNIV